MFSFFSAFRASSVCCLCLCNLISCNDLHSTYWEMCKNYMYKCVCEGVDHSRACTCKVNGKKAGLLFVCVGELQTGCVRCWMRYQDSGGYFHYANFCHLAASHYLDVVTPPLSRRTFQYLNRTWMRRGGGAYSGETNYRFPHLHLFFASSFTSLMGGPKTPGRDENEGSEPGVWIYWRELLAFGVSVYTYLRRLVICKHAYKKNKRCVQLTNQTPVPGCFVYTECIQTVIYDSGSKNLFAFLYPFDVIEKKKNNNLVLLCLIETHKGRVGLESCSARRDKQIVRQPHLAPLLLWVCTTWNRSMNCSCLDINNSVIKKQQLVIIFLTDCHM